MRIETFEGVHHVFYFSLPLLTLASKYIFAVMKYGQELQITLSNLEGPKVNF
jgi:hypothetical protein